MASEAVEEAQVPPGLLDQPVVLEGKRKRKATNKYIIEIVPSKKRVPRQHVGSGTKLQDIPSVDYTLTEKFKADGLRMLYKFCFEMNGKTSTLKRQLKQFQGFEFAKDSGEYKKKKAELNKMTISGLSDNFCAPLCLVTKGTKEEIIDRILDFLMCPTDSGQVAAKKKAQQKKAQQKKKKKGKKEEKKESDSDHQETTEVNDDASGETKSEEPPSTDATKDEEKDDDGDKEE